MWCLVDMSSFLHDLAYSLIVISDLCHLTLLACEILSKVFVQACFDKANQILDQNNLVSLPLVCEEAVWAVQHTLFFLLILFSGIR